MLQFTGLQRVRHDLVTEQQIKQNNMSISEALLGQSFNPNTKINPSKHPVPKKCI